MAISPNDTFTSGQILTAVECNQFPFGVVAYQSDTTNASFTTEAVNITTPSFTAIANRYYRITFFQPQLEVDAANGYTVFKIRKGTTTAGTLISQGYVTGAGAASGPNCGTVSTITTLTAGAQQICGCLSSTNTTSKTASASQSGYLLVEDIGPA